MEIASYIGANVCMWFRVCHILMHQGPFQLPDATIHQWLSLKRCASWGCFVKWAAVAVWCCRCSYSQKSNTRFLCVFVTFLGGWRLRCMQMRHSSAHQRILTVFFLSWLSLSRNSASISSTSGLPAFTSDTPLVKNLRGRNIVTSHHITSSNL